MEVLLEVERLQLDIIGLTCTQTAAGKKAQTVGSPEHLDFFKSLGGVLG